MSTHFKNKAAPARILSGKITAQHAASIAGVHLPEVVRLCREKTIFSVYADGQFWISPAAIEELKSLVLLARPRSPIQQPEIYAQGGIS